MKTIRTIIKRSQAGFLALAIAATFAIVPVRAHDGMEDVIGTVQSVAANAVSVKNAKGKTLSIKLDAKTEYTRGKVQAKQTDIKVGDRVVVHAVEANEVLTAHLVQLPTAKAAAPKVAPKQK